jgi:hypothetical protein
MASASTTQTNIKADAPIDTPVKEPDDSLITSSSKEILSTVRCLAADLVEQFNGGHPGTAMGAAAIGLALWGDAMRFNPSNAAWINRDRFILCVLSFNRV